MVHPLFIITFTVWYFLWIILVLITRGKSSAPEWRYRKTIFIKKYLSPVHLSIKKLPITSNAITFASFVSNLASFYFIIKHYLILGSIFILLGQLFDWIDGTVAQIKNMKSRFGMWFDIINDSIAESGLFLIITVFFLDGFIYGFLVFIVSLIFFLIVLMRKYLKLQKDIVIAHFNARLLILIGFFFNLLKEVIIASFIGYSINTLIEFGFLLKYILFRKE